jgi:serine/threonine-protein kinase mTOR
VIEKFTGKVLHIDFGDCFEVAMNREKFPEKIPFRLTRMLTNAMEVSGIEGNFRTTCEAVMEVLRENKDSLMAMLEAFVHDPLLSWRLIGDNNENEKKEKEEIESDDDSEKVSRSLLSKETRRFDKSPQNKESINIRALQIIERISNKLTGRDFDINVQLDTHDQVNRLIEQATSHSNLCQSYIGWCAFW